MACNILEQRTIAKKKAKNECNLNIMRNVHSVVRYYNLSEKNEIAAASVALLAARNWKINQKLKTSHKFSELIVCAWGQQIRS